MPRDTYIMMRGQYDQPDVDRPVSRAIPSVLGSLPDDLEQPSRLDLARWIVSDENPLTARVVANRYWAMLFGRGLVESVEDFGCRARGPRIRNSSTTWPSTFREGGWDRLALLRGS